MPFSLIFDALRRLPVVIGCVVLATAQPMSGSPSDTLQAESQSASDRIIYPKGSDPAGKPKDDMGYGSPVYLVFAVTVAAMGAWVLWRRRSGTPLFSGKSDSKKLKIEETKSLGNRQYLVVASYEGRKFLLGVTTDKIELLTHLAEGGDED